MKKEKEKRRYYPDYPEVVVHFANRNFNLGDKVKAYFKGRWYSGEVISKYKYPERGEVPYIMIKTDEKVDEDPEAYLNGFGIEAEVTSPRVIFSDEPPEGDEIYRKTYLRTMTPKEKKEWDNPPFSFC